MMGRFLSGISIVLASAACGVLSGGPQRDVKISDHGHQKGHATAFSTPADLRLGFIRENNDGLSYCAEPLPDVALGSEKSASASLAASAAATQSAAATASLAQANETLMTDNRNLRGELNNAIDAYEKDTQKKYSNSNARANSVSAGNSANATLNVAAAARLAVSVSELGGRSPEVLLAREFLYRLCEARANGYFKDPKTYAEQQANALRLIQIIYEARYRLSDSVSDMQFLKSVNDYNIQQKALCTDRAKACEVVAAQQPDKKAQGDAKSKCAAELNDCLKNIELLTLPKPKTGPEKPPKNERQDTVLFVPDLPTQEPAAAAPPPAVPLPEAPPPAKPLK